MSRLLLVVPTLHPQDPAHQALVLVPALARAGFAVHLCTLDSEAALTQPDVPVTALGWTHRLHLPGLWRLRELVRDFQPDVIHVWKVAALRAVRLVLGRRRPRLLISSPLHHHARSVSLSWFDRWLVGNCDSIIASTAAEADRLRQLGLPAQQLTVVLPGVDCETLVAPTSAAERVILGLGALEERQGFREAIWALDVLRYANCAARLVLAGSGPYQPQLERFVDMLRLRDRVHFSGPVADPGSLLRQARVVWVPSLTPSGLHTALQAQAAGVPVVASALPELAEVVCDGATGLLTPPGDAVTLARRTRQLLDDADLHARLAAAGRDWVRERFSADAFVQRMSEVYRRAAAA